jgi:hypothetical protein
MRIEGDQEHDPRSGNASRMAVYRRERRAFPITPCKRGDVTMTNFDAEDEAETILRYLRKCESEAERVEYLSASLRVVRQQGIVDGSRDAGNILGVPTATWAR